MTHTADPILTNLTPNAEIRKTVAGRALPAPVNWVWGVYDPHPFSCLLFDPPNLLPNAANLGFSTRLHRRGNCPELPCWGWEPVFRKNPDTGATAGSQVSEPLSLFHSAPDADGRNCCRCQCRQNTNHFFHKIPPIKFLTSTLTSIHFGKLALGVV